MEISYVCAYSSVQLDKSRVEKEFTFCCRVMIDVCSQIKREMRELRMRGVIRGSHDDPAKKCARCHKKFVWLINSAHVCVQCSHRVCDKCSQQLQQKRWMCCLCLKQLYVSACVHLSSMQCANSVTGGGRRGKTGVLALECSYSC